MESQMREELLACHNLYVTFEEIREVKQAIHEGSLWELVEYRCRGHPKLLSGLKHTLSQHSGWIEEFQPLSRSTFFYSGPESALRPEVLRHKNRLKNLNLKGNVLIKNHRLDNEDEFDWVLDFKPPFGPYPVELKETYPLNAEVIDVPDHESLTEALQNLIELMKLNPGCEFTIALDDFSEHPLMTEIQKLTS
jgi:7-cyano-7-deazaguanine tRNA-ribosyltransferase